jgi:hypothetical protein
MCVAVRWPRFGNPAVRMAIATACFCGRPDFISVRMFAEIVFFEEPLASGMAA